MSEEIVYILKRPRRRKKFKGRKLWQNFKKLRPRKRKSGLSDEQRAEIAKIIREAAQPQLELPL